MGKKQHSKIEMATAIFWLTRQTNQNWAIVEIFNYFYYNHQVHHHHYNNFVSFVDLFCQFFNAILGCPLFSTAPALIRLAAFIIIIIQALWRFPVGKSRLLLISKIFNKSWVETDIFSLNTTHGY